jgi:putative peptide zinc metalloprotease protein
VDPPSRAAGVELIGVLPGSGFTDAQFLVKRDGQFIQLTELLFRTIEGVDGRQTFQEIAEVLTETTEWAVTAEQVEYLVVEKLLPLGVIDAGVGGAIDPTVERSPLMVQAPTRLLDADQIERVSRLTRFLFATPIALGLLTLVVIGHLWLFLEHGIENGFLEVLYSPGLLVAVVGLIVVAALVHEFGHASGLRYAGLKARSIGVGLYLVYPAFFTDVSEGYALPQRAKLRTDLGGIYFHLLFGLALIGLYQVTGWEFLLFTVLLIDLEAARQVLPFGRLDGYWILADLTGIPDPLSQMLPFLRGAIDRPELQGARLPTLRPWVRRVFVTYVVLTLPAIALFIVFLLARLPTLLALVWDALTVQVSQLATAAANAAVITLILATLQIGLICLELGATAFILVKLGKLGVTALARLGEGGGPRRAIALIAGVVAVGGLVFLWGPHVSGLTAGGGGQGVQFIDVPSRSHVEGPVNYDRLPPVGGDHSAVWQNCGFYATAVPAEHAVHSLEHGAVWLTYNAGTSTADLMVLQDLATRQTHVLVSSLPENPAPLVATAWGRQLFLERFDDPRLEEFIAAFRLGSNAPERGGPCEGGTGAPVVP